MRRQNEAKRKLQKPKKNVYLQDKICFISWEKKKTQKQKKKEKFLAKGDMFQWKLINCLFFLVSNKKKKNKNKKSRALEFNQILIIFDLIWIPIFFLDSEFYFLTSKSFYLYFIFARFQYANYTFLFCFHILPRLLIVIYENKQVKMLSILLVFAFR